MTPPRLLKADETYCSRCQQIYINGDAFEIHLTGKQSCLPASKGLQLKGDHWVFEGKDQSRMPRKTTAMAAFDRLLKQLPVRLKSHTTGTSELAQDIAKIQKALEKARDS